MKKRAIILVILAAFLLTGCTLFKPFKPEEAITHPLGTDSLKTGMTKDQVKSLLGEPDSIAPIASTKDMLKTEREEWVYNARYSNSPLNADYFGKTLRLTFDGNNLTKCESSK